MTIYDYVTLQLAQEHQYPTLSFYFQPSDLHRFDVGSRKNHKSAELLFKLLIFICSLPTLSK